MVFSYRHELLMFEHSIFMRKGIRTKNLKLETGTLWKKTLERTEQALRTDALLPIQTESTFMKDGGVDFQVRIISNIVRKAKEKKANPFLPYEEDMFVSDISETHVCLLNKFNVIDHHLLIVTRAFEEQENLLTLKDFEAIQTCMAEFEGLAFYNGGVVAGASQRHKHLQMIPLPMTEKGPRVPVEPLFANVRLEGNLGVVPGLPFVHSFSSLDTDTVQEISKGAEILFKLYRDMLQAVGLNASHEPEERKQSAPYNLLFTRDWMLLVPRSEEFFGTFSINALGFAGALLVQNEQQMEMLKEHGGMAVLRHTAITSV